MITDVRAALADATSFFLAGVMQGSRGGEELADQRYRAQLRELLRSRLPAAEVVDPGDLMVQWLGGREPELRAAHGRLATAGIVRRAALEPALQDLTEVFDRLVRRCAATDVCLAWLPHQEASMGTAVEMWAAHDAGRLVVAVTPMRQNLAVLACSSVIVPDLAALADLLPPAAARTCDVTATYPGGPDG